MTGANVKIAPILIISFLFLVMCAPLAKAEAEEAAVYNVSMTYTVQNGSNKAYNVKLLIDLFGNVSGWGNQEIVSESITLDGELITPEINQTEDNRWTRISLDNFEPNQTKTVQVTQVLKVSAVDLNLNPNNVGTSIPQELRGYTQPVDGLWESTDPAIQEVAAQFADNTDSLYYKARQIFDQVLEQPDGESLLTYEVQNAEHDALWALQNKRGDCTEFSNLMVALMRAQGIPAKVVSGYAFLPLYSTEDATGDIDALAHAYVIIYLPNYGWVPVDAVWPGYVGSFGQTDYAHIAGASIVGAGSVRPDGIEWLSPGYFKTNWQYESGKETAIVTSRTGTIEAEILLNSTLQSPSQITDGVMTVTLVTNNLGRSDVSNVAAELDLDDTMFEVVTQSQQRASLASQAQWVTSFDVRVKDPAYGTTQTLKAKVTFDSADGGVSGSFTSTGSIPVAIAAKSSPPVTAPGQDYTIFLVIGAVVAVVAVIAVVVKRR